MGSLRYYSPWMSTPWPQSRRQECLNHSSITHLVGHFRVDGKHLVSTGKQRLKCLGSKSESGAGMAHLAMKGLSVPVHPASLSLPLPFSPGQDVPFFFLFFDWTGPPLAPELPILLGSGCRVVHLAWSPLTAQFDSLAAINTPRKSPQPPRVAANRAVSFL